MTYNNNKERQTSSNSSNSGDTSKKITSEMINDEMEKTINGHTMNIFPLDAFPRKIQEVIEGYHQAFKLPFDFYGATALAAASSLIGNSFNLRFKNEWYESPAIFMAVVGPSSSGKTPAINAFLKPNYEIERKLQSQFVIAIKTWEEEAAMAKENKEEVPERPLRKELVINDATTEAINKALDSNPNGLLFYQDEILAWIKSLNQYRKGADLEYWINIWKNTDIKVSRKSADPITITNPFVSVIGGDPT